MDEQDNCYIPANESIRREFHSDLKTFASMIFDSIRWMKKIEINSTFYTYNF